MLTVYRKYRAKNFSQIIGQDHVVSVLKQAVGDETVSHAYLFTGPRGTGKTSMARILAKAVNCLDLQQGEPCNNCRSCIGINKGNFLDLIEIDAASNRGIDEIRELKNNVGFLPVEGKYKVYIIDEVHMLTEPAFNALLKTLEEPPKKVLFVLATTEPQKIPLTIISRTQRFDFKLADNKSLEKKLKRILDNEKRAISPAALDIIIKSGRGSFRDAETVLEKVISAITKNTQEIAQDEVEKILGLTNQNLINSLIENLVKEDRLKAFEILLTAESEGMNLSYFVKEVLEETRQRMMNSVKQKEGSGKSIKKYLQIIKEFNAAAIEMRSSLIPVLTIEVAIANLTTEPNTKGSGESNEQAAPVKVKHEVKIDLKKEKEEEKKESLPKLVKTNEKTNQVELKDQLNALKEHWKEILNSAKKYNHFLTAILAKVQLDADEDDQSIIFKVGATFHKKRLDNKETRKILSGLFTKHCGFDVAYKCIIEASKGKGENKSNSKLVEEFFS